MRQNNRRRGRGRLSHNKAGAMRERWLITYADLITLLLIFFVIMFSVSHIDTDKYTSLSKELRSEFTSTKTEPVKSDTQHETAPSAAEQPDASEQSDISDQSDATDQPASSEQDPSSDQESTPEPTPQPMTARELQFREQEAKLSQFKSMIQAYVQDHSLGEDISVVDSEKGISIHLSDQFLFDLGQADIKENSKPLLNKLGSLFQKLDSNISIEGHTDSLPISPGGKYADNWGLSAARALSVLRYLIEQEHLDPDQFQIAGYGDTHPISPNDTEEHRQKNRRVEMIVLRKLQP